MRGTRNRRRSRVSAILLGAAVAVGSSAAVAAVSEGTVPAPETVLGFRPGDDGRLALWAEVRRSFEVLAAHSPRVRVETVGPTTGGRPFLLLTVTSEANQRRIEAIRNTNLRLADPRGLSADERARLVASGRVIVAMTFGVHSTEVGGTLSALTFVHNLATTKEPSLVRALDEAVVVIVPSQNPDGHDLVVEWARRQSGTAFEGTEPPELSHRYGGHDTNRDAYAFLLQETRLVTRHLHDRWRPQVHHDAHQMEPDGPRMFLPPYIEPWEPNVDPALREAGGPLGAAVAQELTTAGLRGIVTSALFDAWSPGRAYIHTHGGVRILSETASCALAEPRFVPFELLRGGIGVDPRTESWNHPRPWRGGRWGLADVVTYQVEASRAILELAARDRRVWLQRFVDVNLRAATTRRPFAFVVPAPPRDRLAAVELQRVLLTGGVEVGRARQPFRAGGRAYAGGSLVVSMRQPWSAFARTILERQTYPVPAVEDRASPWRPYDTTAHTLPLLLGVDVTAVQESFISSVEPVTEARVARGRVTGTTDLCAFAHDWGGLVAASRLLRAGVPVHWGLDATRVGKRVLPAGTFYPAARGRGQLEAASLDLGISARCGIPLPRAARLVTPRVGLYRSFAPVADEGWTRFVFERLAEMPFEAVVDAEVRRGDLRARLDVIVLPDQPPEALLDGPQTGRVPPEFSGGVGTEGVRALRAFVADGGTLVAVGSASRFVVDGFGLRSRGASAGTGRGGSSVFGPGCILAAELQGTSPLLHGLPRRLAVWYEQGPIFDAGGGRSLVRYSSPEPLLSGGLMGEAGLAGRPALMEIRFGRGKVLLFGFRPAYRGQTRGTMPLLLNALFLAATDGPGGAGTLEGT